MQVGSWRFELAGRGMRGTLALSILFLAAASPLPGAVVFSEIMYNPSHGGDFEYIEVHSTGGGAVDLSGWVIRIGIDFTFPPGTSLADGGTLVVARSRERLLEAYPGLSPRSVLGDYTGALSNAGDRLELMDSAGTVVEALDYGDESPWEFTPDGLGASLERRCFTSPPDVPENWRASPVPPTEEAFGGSPGSVADGDDCPPAPRSRPRLFISEIMYHPVLEESLENEHEFIEIHNATGEAVALAGWRVLGGVSYTFPEGASIAAGGYRVVARNREALAEVEAYGLNAADLLGGTTRTLDNGGETIVLVDALGQGVDVVSYDDDFPWPVAADSLGAGESWLPRELLPLEAHRHMGYSLERVSFDTPSSEIANWVVSPLDGATPGRPNAGARAAPLPAVSAMLLQALEDGEDPRIRAGQEVVLQVAFTPEAPSGAVEVRYFVDDIQAEGEAVVAAPMFDDGANGGDLIAGDGIYTATLPAQEDNAIVRYQVRADRGAGVEQVSPRPSHPNPWHAYFVSPVIDTETRTYQLFIAPRSWAQLWINVTPGRAGGCSANARWNLKERAILVHDGNVHDIRVRYQGSRWNRTNGRDVRGWRFPRPTSGPVRALSWRFSFPRYNQLGGRSVVILNKLTQSCPGYNAPVGFKLFELANLPASRTRFVRLHVNGGYFHYMNEYERPGEEMMRRYHREMAEKFPDLPRERVGHLHKSAGCTCDEGPYGWGDFRLLPQRCGFSEERRYAATYDRKTHEWADYSEFRRMVNALHQARRDRTEREFFAEFFDIDLLLNYTAIINWSVPFDDMFQNFFIYQRRSDGKWLFAPWDLDLNFGEWQGPNSSIFMGARGDPSNRSGWWNYLKDSFLKSYRTEYEDRLLLLNNTLLHPDRIAELVDAVTEQLNPAEAAQSPAGTACSFAGRPGTFKSFAVRRFAVVNEAITGARIDAGADLTAFVGQVAQFDARNSRPEPGPEVNYVWDNGMEGNFPTFVFEEPGTFEVTLSVRIRGVDFTDSVTVTVLPLPERAFVESGGQVVFEAESPFTVVPHGEEIAMWTRDNQVEGFSGDGYMEATASRRRTFLSRYRSNSPEMLYSIDFENPGTYHVWIRAFVRASSADTLHVALNGAERPSRQAHQFEADDTAYRWSGESRREGRQVVEVTEAGVQYLSIWIRESGTIVDKILLTRDPDLVPDGLGPDVSATRPVGGEPEPFVRGDLDGSGRVTISDAV
ncbi:MAG: lamin tail domain-containing protein, partial [Planctomycetota bacterium]|nr:lamin tail domain-containing protein [Planctomycetota bacterium]